MNTFESSASPSHVTHKQEGPQRVACYILTCSDTRTPETDTSGQLIRQLLQDHHHTVVGLSIVKDDPSAIQEYLRKAVQDSQVQAIIINGGTGLSKRDSTFETIEGMMEKRVSGFGEIFRYLSYEEIGSAAMLSRATAGLIQGKIVFSTPGSRNAVRLAMEKLILPELGHIIRELTK